MVIMPFAALTRNHTAQYLILWLRVSPTSFGQFASVIAWLLNAALPLAIAVFYIEFLVPSLARGACFWSLDHSIGCQSSRLSSNQSLATASRNLAWRSVSSVANHSRKPRWRTDGQRRLPHSIVRPILVPQLLTVRNTGHHPAHPMPRERTPGGLFL